MELNGGFVSGLWCEWTSNGEEVGAHRVPPLWLPPSSYIRSPSSLSQLTQASSSHMPFGWHLPPLASLSSSRAWCLGEALLKIFSITTTMSLCWRSSERSTTSAAQLEQGAEVVADPYVWPITEALPVCGAYLHHDLEVGKRSTTSLTRTVLVKAFGLRGWVLLKPLQVIF